MYGKSHHPQKYSCPIGILMSDDPTTNGDNGIYMGCDPSYLKACNLLFLSTSIKPAETLTKHDKDAHKVEPCNYKINK
jgi:hypothetical protein